MKLNNAKWCVECDEIFSGFDTCPNCTNRFNLMPVKNYMCIEPLKEVPRANHRKQSNVHMAVH